jgi:hypothetical protein
LLDHLEVGKAAEHLVCYDLIMQGYKAYLSDQGLSYDVVLDNCGKLYRIQVKSTLKTKNINSQGRNQRIAYNFAVRRRGNNGNERLGNKDADIIAVVAHDIKVIAYFPIDLVGQTLQLSPPDAISNTHSFKDGWGKNICEFPIANIIENKLGYYTKTNNLNHCKQGHEYTLENKGVASNGSRYCKECSRNKSREYQRRKRATKID